MRLKKLRQIFRWRLRTIFVLIALVGLGLAFYLKWIEPYRAQFIACEKLVAIGGRVETVAAEPHWMARIVGEDRFHKVEAYNAEGRRITDKDLAPIADMPFLERLYLNNTDVGDQAAMAMGQVKTLRRLSLWRTRISDEGLPHIARCRQLQVLDLHDCCVTGKGLKALEPLVNLRQLKLGGPVNGPGLASLAKLPQLVKLDLRQTRVYFSDLAALAGSRVEDLQLTEKMPASAAAHLGALPNLRNFHATLVEANDDTAQEISACSRLESLDLSGFELTDACLEPLGGLKKLKELRLHGDLTDAALRRLETMPQLTTIEMTGHFSTAAIEQLAKNAPSLSGTIRTMISEAEYGKRRRVGRLAREPLIHLKTHRYGRFDPEKIEYAEVVFPATLEDLAQLQGYRDAIEKIMLKNTPELYRDYNYQCTWSLDGIECFPNLRTLLLPRTEHLARLEDLPQLQLLVIVDSEFSDEDLAHLRLPDTLRSLIIVPSRVTPSALDQLQSQYPRVSMRENGSGRIFGNERWQSPDVGQHSLELVATYSQLRVVQLDGVRGPLDVTPLARLPHLIDLQFSGRAFREPAWRLRQDLPELTSLSFRYAMRTTDFDLEYLRHVPSLQTLSLSGHSVSDNAFERLVHTPDLRNLSLRTDWAGGGSRLGGPWITGRNLHMLATSCQKLERLDLTGTHVRDKYLAALTSLTHLSEIRLSNTHVGDGTCEYLAQLPRLEKLWLNRTNVTDAGLTNLAESSSLTSLYLSYTPITDVGLNRLPRCPTLKLVVVHGCSGITSEAVDDFGKRYPTIRVTK